MGTHVLEAFLVTFGLDPKGFEDGSRRVEEGSERLQERQKELYDGIEESGKKTGTAIKGLAREVVGLGLAFLGAKSIVGFMANIATGAATAERFGKIVGMSTQSVYAWRMAMKSVGGEATDADAALQSIQNVKMGLITGNPDAAALNTYGRLGVSAGDLMNGDPASILKKLSEMQGRMDPQLYGNLLQQLGLPASTINLLMQGKKSVDELIAKFEADTEGMKKAAEEQKKLQESMAALENALTNLLVPALNAIIPLLTELVIRLGGTVERKDDIMAAGKAGYAAAGGAGSGPAVIGAIIGGAYEAWTGGDREHANSGNEGKIYSYLRRNGLAPHTAMGVTAALWAESALDPKATNPSSGATGISQWLSKGRKENFQRIIGRPVRGSSLDDQLRFLVWELKGGDAGGESVLKARDANGAMQAMVQKFLRPAAGHETNRDLLAGAKFIAKHSSNNGSVYHIHGITVITPPGADGKRIASDIKGSMNKKAAMVNSDRVVNP